MDYKELLQELYDRTNQGLDIIYDVVPESRVHQQNAKKKFRYRAGEDKDPSAMIYPPNANDGCYGIVDFGIDVHHKMSPIELYMRNRGYADSDFMRALLELRAQYGLSGELKESVNKPRYECRMAVEGEKDGDKLWKAREVFTHPELTLWGLGIKPEHLTMYLWKPLTELSFIKNGKVHTYYSTDSYPQFIEECPYTDDNGNEHVFYKLYRPKAVHKKDRFLTIGKEPEDYVFGLDALIRAYHQNGDMKLKCVLLVSGGSDAVNATKHGYQCVWKSSETAKLSERNYKTLLQYAKVVIAVPDTDKTGISCGKTLARRFPELKVVWLPKEEMEKTRDVRGNAFHDLKDYLTLHPDGKQFANMVYQAQRIKFWQEVRDMKGEVVDYTLSLTGLCYFLETHDYFILRDEHSKEVRFIHLNGCVVEEVTRYDIGVFLEQWMRDHWCSDHLINKVLRGNDLNKHMASRLKQVELDFSSGTRDSQFFYFRNCVVKVTAQTITTYRYDEMEGSDRYVLKRDIIDHVYREFPAFFDVIEQEDGQYSVTINSTASEAFCFFINACRMHWRQEMELRFAGDAEAAKAYAESHRFCIDGEGLESWQIAEQMQSLANKLYSIGYELHHFKTMSLAWALFLLDSRIGDSDECNGRSGKSLMIKFLECFAKTVKIEAKNPKIVERQFLFSEVVRDTAIIAVDECHKHLDYSFFFGKITNDLSVERKGVDQFTIPASVSPKFIIATNFVIKNMDPSTTDRLLPCVFSDYYHVKSENNDYLESRSVFDDFGHNLFEDGYMGWDADVAFVMQCVQFYLAQVTRHNTKLMPPMGAIEQRQKVARMGRDFQEWAEEYYGPGSEHLDVPERHIEVYRNYCPGVNVPSRGDLSCFTAKLKAYCAFAPHIACYNPARITGSKKDGERFRKSENNVLVAYIYVESLPAEEKVPTSASSGGDATQQEFDFDSAYDDYDNPRLADGECPF